MHVKVLHITATAKARRNAAFRLHATAVVQTYSDQHAIRTAATNVLGHSRRVLGMEYTLAKGHATVEY